MMQTDTDKSAKSVTVNLDFDAIGMYLAFVVCTHYSVLFLRDTAKSSRNLSFSTVIAGSRCIHGLALSPPTLENFVKFKSFCFVTKMSVSGIFSLMLLLFVGNFPMHILYGP